MFYLYILKSQRTGKYYVGQTVDLERRITYHNSGYNKSTRADRPWLLVYKQSFYTRQEAVRLERRITYHNSGYNKSTRADRPWLLVYKQSFYTRQEAVRLENQIKKQKNKK